ncbi:3-deoxy-D-manno-octulosonic acid transferase [Halomarinibacterium sedimenti]|nr:glycosyltransferase N-terminal domain-containing protein [Halomarinibacterium sedimenti]
MQFPKETYFSITYSMMRTLYTFLTYGSQVALWPTQFFSKKMKLFVDGRKQVFQTLKENISSTDKTIWFHCASLGEFEQGLPIMEAIKKEKPDHKLIITFFSPSGYEIKKNTPIADVVTYLPYDTHKNAKQFLKIVHPTLVFFVKYDFWPNYLFELKKQGIRTFLVSGLFRKNQSFFKSYGSFMRKALGCFEQFFVQNENSKKLLSQIGFENVTVSGDTRFDRVSHQIEMDNTLDFMDSFKGDSLCIVCGSAWPEDEAVLLNYINSSPSHVKWVIAPHKIDSDKIASFKNKLFKKAVLFSEKGKNILSENSILILDTIGLLSKVYSYADIAYVGGAMGTTGLHNILEPATFGIPIVIGKNFKKFPEALKLQDIAGLYAVESEEDCTKVLEKFVTDRKFREQTGMITGHFVNSNTGATQIIIQKIS